MVSYIESMQTICEQFSQLQKFVSGYLSYMRKGLKMVSFLIERIPCLEIKLGTGIGSSL